MGKMSKIKRWLKKPILGIDKGSYLIWLGIGIIFVSAVWAKIWSGKLEVSETAFFIALFSFAIGQITIMWLSKKEHNKTGKK